MIPVQVYEHGSALEAANRELEVVMYSVANELRSPIGQRERDLGLLRSELAVQVCGLAGDVYLNTLDKTASRLSAQIYALHSFSRIGRQEILRTSVSMKSLVDEVKHQLETAFPPGDIEWNIGDLPPACGDPSMLYIVVNNLLGNAVECSKHGSPARICVSASIDEKEVRYTVSDNGSGFEPRHAERLSGPFQTLHNNEEYGGNGIDLALVRRIVLIHGGWIHRDIFQGRGAEFTFALPRAEECE